MTVRSVPSSSITSITVNKKVYDIAYYNERSEKPSLPCAKGGGTARRDGRIVKKQKSIRDNPSVSFADSSLYTREPFLAFFAYKIKFPQTVSFGLRELFVW